MRSPDHWQAEALRSFAVDQRIAIKSAKGPGKTTLLAWCGWNFLVTREHCNIAAMSISGDNLGNRLWKELVTWRLLVHVTERWPHHQANSPARSLL